MSAPAPRRPLPPDDTPDAAVAALIGRTLRLLVALVLVTTLVVMLLRGLNLL